MKSVIEKKEDKSIKLTITVPAADFNKARDEVITETVKTSDLKGFRKGKAPRDIVESSIDPTKLNEEAIRKVLPQAYMDALKEHNITPVVQPRIQVTKLAKDNDLVFTAETCEMPDVNLGDYKKIVKDITAKTKIVVPGKEQQEPNIDEIIKALLDNLKIEIPSILIEQETERQLSQTLDEIKKLGLTLDRYLQSTGRNADQMREDFEKNAKQELGLEFLLQAIAEKEKIEVTTEDLNKAIADIKDPKERDAIENNKYMFATILRKQKTLDYLKTI